MQNSELNECDCDGYRPIHHALLADDVARLDQLLSEGALLNLPTEGGEGILSLALRAHSDEKARLWIDRLLNRGAELIDRDRNGDTALHVAARSGYTESVRCLMDAGADPYLKNVRGERPIDLAQSNPTLRELLVPKTPEKS